MEAQVYLDSLAVMQSRRGPYAGMDIPEFYALMKELFTPQEAAVNNILGKEPLTLQQIAVKLGQGAEELLALVDGMADKGLCGAFSTGGERRYQGLPFMPGIFEYQFIGGSDSARSRSVAHLIKAYKNAWTAQKGVEKITFPVTRVIPVHKTIDARNQIHTYDQVATYIQKYDSIGVGTCFCRHAAKLRGEDTHGFPMDVCMWFGPSADYMIERLGGKKVTKAEAMAVLDRSEQAGLLHMSRNTTDDIQFLCNCDRWHCEVVTQVLQQPKPGLIFNSGYQPRFDPEKCAGCETCIERCPPQALAMHDERRHPVVNLERCFGCAVCATGCPEEAVAMEAKPGFKAPPRDGRELAAALKASRSQS